MPAPSTSILDSLTENTGAAPPSANLHAVNVAFSPSAFKSIDATGSGTVGASDAMAYYSGAGAPFTADQESYVTWAARSSNAGDRVYHLLRWDDANQNGYRLDFIAGVPNTWRILRITAGAVAATLVTITDSVVHTRSWAIAQGNLLTFYGWDGTAWVQMCQYDTTPDTTKYTGSGFAGIGVKGTIWRLASFGGGSLGAAAPTFIPKILQYG